MFDPKAEIPVDPEEEEAVRKFFLSPVTPEERQMPSTSPERRGRSVDPLDAALGLNIGTQARIKFRGVVQIPHNPKPRLVKHNFARR